MPSPYSPPRPLAPLFSRSHARKAKHARKAPAHSRPTWEKRILSGLFTVLCTALAIAFLTIPWAASSAGADEQHPISARILYHFTSADQLDAGVSFADRTPENTIVCMGERWSDEEHTYIRANCHPALMSVNTDATCFRVLKDYASTSATGNGTQDITAEATYRAEEGIVELPAHYAEADLSVAWYVDQEQQQTELPFQAVVHKTIDGVSSEATIEQAFEAGTQTISIKLFEDEEIASHVENIRVMQGGSELTEYVYQDGSLCITASPLGGPIDLSLDDDNEALSQGEDTQSAFNTEPPLISIFSAANPVVGERFTIGENGAFVRTCISGNNTASVMGWPEKGSTYGFVVHFTNCPNPEVVNADQNHVAAGGVVHNGYGDTFDYSYVKGWHFAWGECQGNVDNNGVGEPRVQGGWVEVTNVDYATQTVSYRFFLDVCSDYDGHNMQNIVGTFQVHEDLVGYIELNKESYLADISNNNPCYTLEGAKYGIYADEACTDLKQTLTTDAHGHARSKALLVGTYYVKELSAAQGYALDVEPHEVSVAAGKTRAITLDEVPQSDPTPILLAKHDSDRAYNDTYNEIQGGATSFAGAEFTIRFFPTLEQDYGSGEPLRTWVVATDERGIIDLRQGEGCKISGDDFFHDTTGAITLPIGTYEIRETKAPTGYRLNESAVVRTVVGYENSTESVSSYNTPIIADDIIRGGLELEKRDAESGLQSPLGAATLNNTTFTITNNNSHEVNVNGIFYQPGEVCATLVVQNGAAAVSATTLPYGEYLLTEVSAGDGYNVSEGEPRTFFIANEGQIVCFSDSAESADGQAFKNHVKRGDLNFVKVHEASNERLANVPFKITSHTTGESHVVVTDANGEIDTASSFVKHTIETNANDAAEGRAPGRGVWFGRVNDEHSVEPRDDRGALPYDTYTLEELPCTANEGLDLVTTTFSIYREAQHLDFGMIENHDPLIPWIVTAASDAQDHDKLVNAANGDTLNDHVRYGNLAPDQTYTLRATLVDPHTGEQLEGAVGETTFTAQAATGTTEVSIPLDKLEGTPQDIVVYETLLKDENVVLEHHEKDNSEQTVSVLQPRIATNAVDVADGDHDILNDAEARLVDTVSFENLTPGKEYRVSGTLMSKHIDEQGQLQVSELVDEEGNAIHSEIIFTPADRSGSVEVSFVFNATMLEVGSELVVYEKLTLDETEIAQHEDPEDENQTVRIIEPEAPPAPETPEEPTSAAEQPPEIIAQTFAKTGSALAPLLITAAAFAVCGIGIFIVADRHRRKAEAVTAAIARTMLGKDDHLHLSD